MAKAHGRPHVALSPEALQLVAARFRVLSDPARLAVLQCLMKGPATVTDLAELVEQSVPAVSRHLSALAREGLLHREREGQFVRYALADASVVELCSLVCGSLSSRFEELKLTLPVRR